MKRGVWGSKPFPCNEHPVQFGQAYVWSHPLLSLFTCYVTASRLKIISSGPSVLLQSSSGWEAVDLLALCRLWERKKNVCVCVRGASATEREVMPCDAARHYAAPENRGENCRVRATNIAKTQARRSSWHGGFACARTGTHAHTR